MSGTGPITPQTVVILGIPFNDVSFADTVEWVRQRVVSRRPAYIATVNMDFIMQAWRDPELQRILLEADLVVADGIPIVWLSRLVGPGLKERVTGSDLVPMLAALAAREGFSLFCLGGAPGVAEKAAGNLVERNPGLRIAGCYSPPKADLLNMDNPGILSRVAAADPHILLVAFGAPKQEKWVNQHIRKWRVPVAIGVGGSLDFLAGMQKRAPQLVRKLALEWLWRMLSDPRRLGKRYLANLFFLSGAVCRLLALRYAPRAGVKHSAAAPAEFDLLGSLKAKRVVFPPTSDVHQMESFRTICVTEARTRSLVIDLSERTWLNSRDLGILLDLSRLSRAGKRRLYLLASHPRVAGLLRFVRLDRHLDVAETAAELIRSLRERLSAEDDGNIVVTPERRLVAVLPVELKVTNLDAFKVRYRQAWQEADDRGGPTGVTVDGSAVEFIDTAAMAFLVRVRKDVNEVRGDFRCFGFHGPPRRSLKMANLDFLVAE